MKTNLLDETELVLYRGEGVSVDQMCALLPTVFSITENSPVTVVPYPIFSAKNDHGKDVLILFNENIGAMVLPVSMLLEQEVIKQ